MENSFNKVRRYLIILTLILAGCNYTNTDKSRIDNVENFKVFFYENKEIFEGIIDVIKNDKKLNTKIGRSIRLEEFDELTNKKLRRLEIENVTISNTDCDQLGIEFTTSWTKYPIGRLYLANDCSDKNSKKGSYQKIGFIEIWGLGDEWLIWIDSDPI